MEKAEAAWKSLRYQPPERERVAREPARRAKKLFTLCTKPLQLGAKCFMPEPEFPHWDDPRLRYDMEGLRWDSPLPEYIVAMGREAALPAAFFTLNPQNTMEYWEITLERAQATLPVWLQYVPALKIGTQGTAELQALIAGFEPLVQARTAAQDASDAAFRDVQADLLKMKVLGTKVPKLIEGHLEENERLMKDVDDLYRVNSRTESTILKRARELIPVWERANTAMAALTPPQPAIVRAVQGAAHTVAMLKALVDAYTARIGTFENKEELLNAARENLRAHDRSCDRLNKRWYSVVKQSHDPGEPVSQALTGIPTEPGTSAPETIEIDTVSQGGEGGLQVLVKYIPGGGDHATTKSVQWQVVGTDVDFANTAPLDASGNALGPFEVGKVVKIRTLVANSVATRTTAPRTITIAEPIE